MKWNTLKKGTPLLITWDDAIGDASAWIDGEVLEDIDCALAGVVESVGTFHSLGKDRVYLYGMHQVNVGRVSNLQSIPVSCIRKVRKLK